MACMHGAGRSALGNSMRDRGLFWLPSLGPTIDLQASADKVPVLEVRPHRLPRLCAAAAAGQLLQVAGFFLRQAGAQLQWLLWLLWQLGLHWLQLCWWPRLSRHVRRCCQLQWGVVQQLRQAASSQPWTSLIPHKD